MECIPQALLFEVGRPPNVQGYESRLENMQLVVFEHKHSMTLYLMLLLATEQLQRFLHAQAGVIGPGQHRLPHGMFIALMPIRFCRRVDNKNWYINLRVLLYSAWPRSAALVARTIFTKNDSKATFAGKGMNVKPTALLANNIL